MTKRNRKPIEIDNEDDDDVLGGSEIRGKKGHNKPPKDKKEKKEKVAKFGGVSADQLRTYMERIERLEEEKSNIAADIRDVFYEAKGNGYDTKTMRQVLKLRKMEGNEREEQEYLLETYLRALGMIAAMDDE